MRGILKKPRVSLELMRFSGAHYDELWNRGFITSNDRVELLDGHFIKKPESTPQHNYALLELYQNVMIPFQNRALTVCRGTIQLPQDGRPDPDITLFKFETPRDRLPLPKDIYLVIEVSDSTLARDRDVKLELYARDGIVEYWIVNLEQNQLEVYRDPDGTRYATSFTVKNVVPTACLAFPDDAIEWAS
jgi:Uma2 family endonuclease